MIYAYPVNFIQDENGTIIAQFPDVPEAITVGKDKDNAFEWAQDAIVVALSGYMDEKKDIPKPSECKKGQSIVIIPPLESMKLAIYQSMREQGITQVALGKRIGIDSRQIRRILDLNHNTAIPHLIRTLKSLGKSLVIDIKDAAFV